MHPESYRSRSRDDSRRNRSDWFNSSWSSPRFDRVAEFFSVEAHIKFWKSLIDLKLIYCIFALAYSVRLQFWNAIDTSADLSLRSLESYCHQDHAGIPFSRLHSARKVFGMLFFITIVYPWKHWCSYFLLLSNYRQPEAAILICISVGEQSCSPLNIEYVHDGITFYLFTRIVLHRYGVGTCIIRKHYWFDFHNFEGQAEAGNAAEPSKCLKLDIKTSDTQASKQTIVGDKTNVSPNLW